MWPIRFFHPILDALDRGDVIRTAVVFVLRALGVLTVLAGLYLLVEILKLSFQLPAQGTIGGLLFAIIFVAAIASLTQILFYRAESVRNLGESAFTVIPIFSILFRTMGETYATSGVAIGVGGCLFIWLSGLNPAQMLPGAGQLLPAVAGRHVYGWSAVPGVGGSRVLCGADRFLFSGRSRGRDRGYRAQHSIVGAPG